MPSRTAPAFHVCASSISAFRSISVCMAATCPVVLQTSHLPLKHVAPGSQSAMRTHGLPPDDDDAAAALDDEAPALDDDDDDEAAALVDAMPDDDALDDDADADDDAAFDEDVDEDDDDDDDAELWLDA